MPPRTTRQGSGMTVAEIRITGIIDWQMARVVPRREASGLSLLTDDMSSLCGGNVSLSADHVALAEALRHKGIPKLSGNTGDEKVRRFFWGLALELKWSYTLPLTNAILQVFGVDQDWTRWMETALKEYETDERLKGLVEHHSSS
ncbi:hypothetical protein ACRE_034880 [Hapsidospora chrysogenum ATCC 11550]|uniref:Uncharacterized protein n=1 Tax=Hapsidospora chrysogenum (strain ATCC 11550 / CBS 779.69 / DSM 880 / IAM 14645 / JCM 23072 / IMI 49137) TaxID=857340 RepID=A0A086T8N1_HAPC1|nr:hypothetical protein ACRE_034880 [Hapsidospora chrysogenum ATCC 11550]